MTNIKDMYEKLELNGSFDYDGKHYVLIQEAHDGYNHTFNYCLYAANAICTSDSPDEEGWMPCYEVEWNVGDVLCDFDHVDEDNPDRVEVCGEYNLEQRRMV